MNFLHKKGIMMGDATSFLVLTLLNICLTMVASSDIDLDKIEAGEKTSLKSLRHSWKAK